MENNITRDEISDYLNSEFGLTKKDCNEIVMFLKCYIHISNIKQ